MLTTSYHYRNEHHQRFIAANGFAQTDGEESSPPFFKKTGGDGPYRN
jgi:hypothetical protein